MEKMKLTIANAVAGILSGIKINKISDKEIKSVLIKDYIQLKKLLKEAEEERQELVTKFQSDWQSDIFQVAALRRDNKPIEGHDEYLEAENDANKEVGEIFNRDIEVEIIPVELDKFISAIGDEDLTIETVSFLQDNGILK